MLDELIYRCLTNQITVRCYLIKFPWCFRNVLQLYQSRQICQFLTKQLSWTKNWENFFSLLIFLPQKVRKAAFLLHLMFWFWLRICHTHNNESVFPCCSLWARISLRPLRQVHLANKLQRTGSSPLWVPSLHQLTRSFACSSPRGLLVMMVLQPLAQHALMQSACSVGFAWKLRCVLNQLPYCLFLQNS